MTEETTKYKLTINDPDNVLINTIPKQPKDGFKEGTEVDINVKYGPKGNKFISISGEDKEIINKAVYHVTMDSDKSISLNSDEPEPTEAETPNITENLPDTTEIPLNEESIELTIKAEVSDGGILSYEWTKDGTLIDTNLPTITVTEEGEYKCTVTNTLDESTATAESRLCVVTKEEFVSVVYNFTSYSPDGSTEYGTGKAETEPSDVEDYVKVKIIENNPVDSGAENWIGKEVYISSAAQIGDDVLYPLYQKESDEFVLLQVSVKINS